MARYRQTIGGDDDEDSYAKAYFARQQQADPRMEMAMQLLGLQERQQTAKEKQALDERQQAALEKLQSGQLAVAQMNQQTAKMGAESEAEARRAGITSDVQRRMDEAGKEVTRKEEAAATLAANKEAKDRETAEKLMKDMLEHGELKKTDPEYELLQERASPGITEEKRQLKETVFNRQVGEGLAKYQGLDEKAKKALAANPAALGTPEVYAEILKQAGVQTPAGSAALPKGPNVSVANLLWNAPGGIENIFRGIANVGGKAIYGRDVPQYSYVPWTEVNVAGGGGPPTPVGPPPETPLQPGLGGYGPMVPQEAVPEWQYGVGTRRPPSLPVDDILAKTRFGQ
jgi:hypothetical protein